MKAIKKDSLWLVAVATILFGCAQISFGFSYYVLGLEETTPGNYAQWPNNMYKVNKGYIFDYIDSNPNDECDYYTHDMSDKDYCGSTHKAGGNKFNHWHVEGGVSFPTTEVSPDPEIKSIESQVFWDAYILDAGYYNGERMSPDGSAYYGGLADSQDSDSASGSPDLTYNCHGYAFNQDGKSDYKLLINDGATGAGVIVNPANGVYTQVTHPGGDTSLLEDIMYMGTHTNFISDCYDEGESTCHNVLQLKFKYRCSRIYTYNYDAPGRIGDDTFGGSSPTYYE